MKQLISIFMMMVLGGLILPPMVQAQDGTKSFAYEIYNDNLPVLPIGEAGEWDSASIWGPQVFQHDDLYYMFYTGNDGKNGVFNGAIGYATSPDGLAWMKSPQNPVFQHNNSRATSLGRIFIEDDGTWVMYYTLPSVTTAMPGQHIYRTTALNPDGEWVAEGEIVLDGGESETWNYSIGPQRVIKRDGQYFLYYSGFTGNRVVWRSPRMGVAISDDGIHFKHMDDPILGFTTDDESWNSFGITSQSIVETEDGLEVFYIGHPRNILTPPNRRNSFLWIGYANSLDGLEWGEAESNPIIETPETGWPLLSVIQIESEYFFYYDRDWGRQGISLTIGTLE